MAKGRPRVKTAYEGLRAFWRPRTAMFRFRFLNAEQFGTIRAVQPFNRTLGRSFRL